MNILACTTKKRVTTDILLALATIVIIVMALASQNILINMANAETGKGTDVFKVILTIFGVDKSKGDMVAIVTTNNGEASKVKLLESDAPYVIPLNASEGETSGHLVEYVATFPNVVVNPGAEYKACVLTVKDLVLLCKTSQNSPANRPEFIDISLDEASASTRSGTEDLGIDEQIDNFEEQIGGEISNEDNNNNNNNNEDEDENENEEGPGD
ncbi:MAG TPA: hypothetical protein VKA95_12885 [Nitrososphaeraceae archaeon]|nr:hypothetical protein [Nitrososphaeraceae archaeon]